MNKLKVLGVAVLAVFAVSAIAASAAQAGEFHSEIEQTFLFGEQEGENTFTTTFGTFKCKEAKFNSLNAQVGTKVSTSDFKTNTIIVQPQYSKCTAFGQTMTFDNPPVETGAPCDYHFASTIGGANVKLSGTPVPTSETVACETKVTVPSGNCSLVINQQTPGTPTVTFANTTFAGKGALRMSWGVKGLRYTVEGPKGAICGKLGEATNGELSGSVVLRGYKSSTHTEAEQVAIKYE